MRCHYTYTENGEKVLIPGCMGTAAHSDISFCTCHSEVNSFDKFERNEFNVIIRAKDEKIQQLEKDVAYYNRQLKKVLEKRLKRKIR